MTDSPPNLQEWIARYGGYAKIPWTLWDSANAEWQERRREVLRKELEHNRRPKASAS
jgi:hypothetical protein